MANTRFNYIANVPIVSILSVTYSMIVQQLVDNTNLLSEGVVDEDFDLDLPIGR